MKIARALSVGDGKGVVNWVASQSRDGTAWRGKVAEWLSGAEKSRHLRHDALDDGAVDDETRATGLEARILERSGRDARGICGGDGPVEASVGFGDVPLDLPLVCRGV